MNDLFSIRFISLVVTAILLSPTGAIAQAQLVKDINTSSSICGSNPLIARVTMNNIMYFSAMDATNGDELWRSDGTVAGTWMVKDIYPGANSSYIAGLTVVDGLLYFNADDGNNGVELWRSDGTAAGTYMLKDINEGDNSSTPSMLTDLNGTLLFAADDGITGIELWKSDGTASGTVLVKDIYSGSTTSGVLDITLFNGFIFFQADDGVNGLELWKSDGTTAGTVLVKDINAGSSGSGPAEFAELNGILYFGANNGTDGHELWRTNGTSIGTYQVKDIFSGASGSAPLYLMNVNNTIFFRAASNTNDVELWKTDGSASGTVLVKDIYSGLTGSYPSDFTNVGGLLYFKANDGVYGSELYVSDGTTAGTGLVKDIEAGSGGSGPQYLTAYNNTVIFRAYSPASGTEIWRSDGTEAGTYIIKDIDPGISGGSPEYLYLYNNAVYFQVYENATHRELWKTDGTTAGTVLFKNICPDVATSSCENLTDANGTLFFVAYEPVSGPGELWKSDGTAAGTISLDAYPGSGGAGIFNVKNVNGRVFFNPNGVNGFELWKSDGTVAGTALVKDVMPGINGSSPSSFEAFQGELYCSANNGTDGVELWKSDGTETGTVMVKDIASGSGHSVPTNLTNVNDALLFFSANDGVNGQELWKSDGTEAGTVMVKDIRAGGNSSPGNMKNVNGTLYFKAMHDTYGLEIWISDGTTAGTQLLKDIGPGASDGVNASVSIIDLNGTAFFFANDGTNGFELWKSDGTTAGTVIVKDIFPGSSPVSWFNPHITRVGNYVYFQADDGVNGSELWRSDGTAAGTTMVKDIYPGSFNSLPINMVNFNDTLFFTADNGINGYELWTSTGTAQTTVLVKDIYPGAGSSSPANFVKSGNALFFTADNGVTETELWKFTTPSPLQVAQTVTHVSCNGLANGAINLTVSGGTQPYTFSWSNSATTEDVSGLAPGTFSVSIMDALGWTVSKSYTVTQPATLNASLASKTNVTCFNGSNGAINLNASGGTMPYTFQWSNNATTQNISGLTANNYSVLIEDVNGCTATFASAITQPLAVSAFTNVIDASCNSGSNGIANVTVVMGVSPYTFLWSANANSQTTQTANGLSAGTYTVTVTDANGCAGNFTATITQPPAYSTSITITNVNCYGSSNGSANLTVSGATPSYTYSWSNGATTQDITSIMAGTYSVIVTDSKGCTTVAGATITQPPLLNPNFSVTDVTCNGLCNGTANVNPSGGTPPYIYSWQTVPVQTSQTATGLCPGNYNITITDNNGCVNVPGVTVSQPNTLVVTISVTNASCANNDGSLTANVSGGTTPYTFSWSHGSSGQTVNTLAPGNYSVTVTDANGCSGTASATVSVSAVIQQICLVTVDSTSLRNFIVWEKPIATNIDSFRIWRDNAPYSVIGTIPYSAASEFIDAGASPKTTYYRYKISAIDTCGNESALGAEHQTINLQASPGVPPAINLDWNDAYGFSFPKYYVWRDSNNTGFWTLLDSIAVPTTQYIDTAPPTDSARYVISINHPFGCTSSIKNPNPMATTVKSGKSNSSDKIGNPTTAPQLLSENRITVYPNPSRGTFTISSNYSMGEICIYNALGENVYCKNIQAKKTDVIIPAIADGIYQLQVETSSGIANRKIVISR